MPEKLIYKLFANFSISWHAILIYENRNFKYMNDYYYREREGRKKDSHIIGVKNEPKLAIVLRILLNTLFKIEEILMAFCYQCLQQRVLVEYRLQLIAWLLNSWKGVFNRLIELYNFFLKQFDIELFA
jgi:hypothetical protein